MDEFYLLVDVFLFSSCDINSSRKPGLNGETPDVCKTLESPLHLGNNKKFCFYDL